MGPDSENFTHMKLANDTRAFIPDEARSALLDQGRELTYKSEFAEGGKSRTSINGGDYVESETEFKSNFSHIVNSGEKGYALTFTDTNPDSKIVRYSTGKYGIDSADPERKTMILREETTIMDEAGNLQNELLNCKSKKLEEHKYEVDCDGSHYNTKAELEYRFKSKGKIDDRAASYNTTIEFTDPANLYLGEIEQKIYLDVPAQKLKVEGKATPANNTK